MEKKSWDQMTKEERIAAIKAIAPASMIDDRIESNCDAESMGDRLGLPTGHMFDGPGHLSTVQQKRLETNQ